MVLALGLDIRLMRFFRRKEIAKPTGFAVDGNACAPLILEKDNANKPRFVTAIRAADILRISGWADYAKIAQSVIMLIAVYMVNKTSRPFTMRQQPRKSVRFVNFSAIAYSDVSSGEVTGDVTRLDSFGNSFAPHQNPCFGVVAENGAEMFGGHDFNAYLKTTGGQA